MSQAAPIWRRNIRSGDSFPSACEESFGQCPRAFMPNISGWQRLLQRLQAPIYLSDGLGIILVENGVKPIGRSGGDVALGIIEEYDLLGLHPYTLAGERIDAGIRLGEADFVRIDDEVHHFSETIAVLFTFARAVKADAEQGGEIAREEDAEVGDKLRIRDPKISIPEIFDKGFQLRWRHADELAQSCLPFRL